MRTVENLKRRLRPGQVYRRSQLAKFSSSVDHHLKQLVKEGVLEKLNVGMYYRPRKSTFGTVPADGKKVVAAFLKNGNFLMVSLNAYNELKVGTTQLYNERLVYNEKRSGHIRLDGQNYYFLKHRKFPKKISEEFLLVDLMNNVNLLAEDHTKLKARVLKRAQTLGLDKVRQMAMSYGKVATKKFFNESFDEMVSANSE